MKKKNTPQNELLLSSQFNSLKLKEIVYDLKIGCYIQEEILLQKFLFETKNSLFYEAYHEVLKQKLLVKVLKLDPEKNEKDINTVRRLDDEILTISVLPLKSENILRYYDFNTIKNNWYILMGYVENGISLKNYLYEYNKKNSTPKGLKNKHIKIIIKGILNGLKFLHENGIIHNTLNTENVLVNNDLSIVKIINYGLTYNDFETKDYPYYSAPELCSNKIISYETDIWSIGCILFELMCGFKPYYKLKNFDAYDTIIKTILPIEASNSHIKDIFYDKKNRKALRFLNKCFRTNEGTRPLVKDLLNDDFLKDEINEKIFLETF